MKSEKLIIVGKSGAGKDYLVRKLKEDKNLNPGIKTTTRPSRKLEVDGVTYNFISDKEFKSTQFIVEQSFYVEPKDSDPTTYHYGYTMKEFESNQVFQMTPGELEMLDNETRKLCFVVYLDIDREIRESRLFRRKDVNDSIRRRMDGDEIDFKNFQNYDLKITDPEFTVDLIYDLME